MKTVLLTLLSAATIVAAGATPSQAGDRYADRPPVMVSPDLSAPWVLQLGRAPGIVRQNRQVAQQPQQRLRYARPAQPDRVQTAAVQAPARRMVMRPQINPIYQPGFEWAVTHKISQKKEWPEWRPPAEMIAREAAKGRYLPTYLAGGIENPLGARALYLGSTLYRIHGTNQPWTIGGAVSSGCIRMRNEDVVDLYERVNVGTTVEVI